MQHDVGRFMSICKRYWMLSDGDLPHRSGCISLSSVPSNVLLRNSLQITKYMHVEVFLGRLVRDFVAGTTSGGTPRAAAISIN